MYNLRFLYFITAIPLLFLLTGWRGPYPSGGGAFFIAGVQVLIAYVILAGICSVIYYVKNKEKFQIPEEENEEYLVDTLRLFKIFWVFPMFFFIIILAVLLFLEFVF